MPKLFIGRSVKVSSLFLESLVIFFRKASVLCLLTAFTWACSGGSSKKADVPGYDISAPDNAGSNNQQQNTLVEKTTERPLYKNKPYYLESYRPQTCQTVTPCMAVVLIPPGLEAGTEYLSPIASDMAAALGGIVFVYNPPGRGAGSTLTAGEEDYNGLEHRGLLIDILKRVELKGEVISDQLGVVSFGWGLAVAAGAMSSVQGPAGYIGKFLVDVEGPVTRCDITVAPFTPDGDVVINGDGDETSSSRCNLCGGECNESGIPGFCSCSPSGSVDCGLRSHPRFCKNPVGGEAQNPPTAYVCNKNTEVISRSGNACDEDGWWNEREPARLLPQLVAKYQRLQFRFDHALPSSFAGREAYHLTLTGPAGIYRIYNDMPPSQSLPDIQACAGVCELDKNRWPSVNGFGSNLFTQAHPDYAPVEFSTFTSKILPAFIKHIAAQ